MKRNKTLRIAIVLLALVMVSTIGMAGTLARYVSDINATAQAVRAGRWHIAYGDGFALTTALTPVGAGNTITPDPASANTNIIVPGSLVRVSGTASITNNSEVPAEIFLESFSLANNNTRILFSSYDPDHANFTEWQTAAVFQAAFASTALATLQPGATTNPPLAITFYAYWTFQQANVAEDGDVPFSYFDGIDTAYGSVANATDVPTNGFAPTLNLLARQLAA